MVHETLEESIARIPVDDLRLTYAYLLRDWAEDDMAVRESAKPFLTDFEINGDSYGVPTIVDIVNLLCERLADVKKLSS